MSMTYSNPPLTELDIDETLTFLRNAYYDIVANRHNLAEGVCDAVENVYETLREPLMAGNAEGYVLLVEIVAEKYPDAFDLLVEHMRA
jgi:hypothetical protein